MAAGKTEPDEEPSAPRNWLALPLTRRSLLSRGAGAGAVMAGGALLAACGSSSKSSSSSSASASSSSSSATSAGSSSAAAAVPSSQLASQLREILDLPTGKAAGQGLSIKMGCDFSLSGSGTAYGIPMYQGTLLGLAHIKAAGGPDFQLSARDSPAGNVTQGTQNTREFGSLGCPVVLTSQGGGNGGGAPFYDEYKMWAVDAGAAEKYNDNKPYLYQARAAFTEGLTPTMIEYLKLKRPDAKKVSYLAYDIAGVAYATTLNDTKASFRAAGYTIADPVLIEIGTGDWSTPFAKVQQQNPDLIISGLASNDIGLMLKTYSTAGIGKKIVGVDYLPPYAVVAGAEGVKAYEFCFDYFPADAPANEWAKLFVSSYQAAYHELPIYYAANYYEQGFVVWELVRRIIAKGGDPTKQGTAYVDAINESGLFPSVYGTGVKTGSLTFDLTTHALKRRPVAYGQALANGTGEIYANADTSGEDFALTALGKTAPTSDAADAV